MDKTKHPLYKAYWNMRARCYNPNTPNFHCWGGKGVMVCDRWMGDFWAFVEDVSALPYYGEPGRSLDRWPDPNGNYEVTNVRWATQKEQVDNSNIYKFPAYSGEANVNSKLTDHDVEVILIIRKLGFSQTEIGKMFNVSHGTIGAILRGETWKHIPR